MAYVVVRDHYGKVLQKATLEKSLLIGRSADCDIRIPDTQASREHCELTTTLAGVWILRDRGSRNGTYVNGKAVRGEHPLRDGDVIEVGPARIAFFTAATRRTRAADPVLAGLTDAESTTTRTASTWEPPGLGPSESSLFATRVMVAPNDESTVAGAQGVHQNRPEIVQAKPPAITQNSTSKLPRRKWSTLVGALGLIAASTAIWIYLG